MAVPKGAAKLDAPDKLAGTRIGVAAQTTSQAYVQKLGDVTVVPYGSVDQAVEALGAGKIDGVMAGDLALRAAIVGGEPVELSGGAYFYEPLAFAIRPGEDDWLALLDATIATMKRRREPVRALRELVRRPRRDTRAGRRGARPSARR